MSTPEFSIYAGDTKTIDIPMIWEAAPFEPAGEWSLLLTAKKTTNMLDPGGQFQKTNLAGIAVNGSTASVELVGPDTNLMQAVTLSLDIRAQHNTTGERRVVARVKLAVERPVSLDAEATLPIYTTNPPVRGETIVYNRFNGHYYQLFVGLDAADPEATVPTIQAELFSTTPVSAAAPVGYDRFNDREVLFFIDQSYPGGIGDGVPTIQSEFLD